MVDVAIRNDASITVREIDGEIVVLDRRFNRLHQFNGTASFIFKRCGEGLAASAVAAALVREFEVADELAQHDVEAFLGALREMDLLDLRRELPLEGSTDHA
jgi:hypothetical protein